ncbi:hypothetical protein Tco_0122994 [Tanacetum coccineum]
MARDMVTWLESPPYWLKSSEVGKPLPKFTADYKNQFENQTITVSSSILLKLGVIEANKGMHEVNIISRAQNERAEKRNPLLPTLLQVLFGLSASANVSPLAHDLLLLVSNENNGALLPVVMSSEYTLRATLCYLFILEMCLDLRML